jgi:uncharacterized protein (DUF3820 family)
LWKNPTIKKLTHKMPFGKYEEDTLSIYQSTMWFGIKIKVSQRRIREQLKLIYELKLNGLEERYQKISLIC